MRVHPATGILKLGQKTQRRVPNLRADIARRSSRPSPKAYGTRHPPPGFHPGPLKPAPTSLTPDALPADWSTRFEKCPGPFNPPTPIEKAIEPMDQPSRTNTTARNQPDTPAPPDTLGTPGHSNTPAPPDLDRCRHLGAKTHGWAKLDWPVVIAIAGMHVLAIGALFPGLFSWSALVACVVLYYLTGGVGVTLTYHRLLTHRSFKCPKWLEYVFTAIACCAWQGGPVSWVGTHRIHHKHSDHDLDPHSPRHGFSWAHTFWVCFQEPEGLKAEDAAKDLLRDPGHRLLNRYFWVPQFGLMALTFAMGYGLWHLWPAGSAETAMLSGLSWLVWGVGLRCVLVYHVTWFVNSATHTWGYRNYDTEDASTNLWWVGLLAMGEGWHNNHHAHPRSASHGLRWYELDPTYWFIQGMAKLGLAWDVVMPKPEQMPDARPIAAGEAVDGGGKEGGGREGGGREGGGREGGFVGVALPSTESLIANAREAAAQAQQVADQAKARWNQLPTWSSLVHQVTTRHAGAEGEAGDVADAAAHDASQDSVATLHGLAMAVERYGEAARQASHEASRHAAKAAEAASEAARQASTAAQLRWTRAAEQARASAHHAYEQASHASHQFHEHWDQLRRELARRGWQPSMGG